MGDWQGRGGYEPREKKAPVPPNAAEVAEAMAQHPKLSHSPELGALAAALARAQGAMTPALRNAENPGRKRDNGKPSTYADLAAGREAWNGPLSANELALTQFPAACGSRMVLVTILAHSSGQWIRSDYPIDCPSNDPQRIGSAITYARRYVAFAVTGIAPEDDDGNAATYPVRQPRELTRNDPTRGGTGGQTRTPPQPRPGSDQARRSPGTSPPRAAGKPDPAAWPAWRKHVEFRVTEANDEWAATQALENVPRAGRTELVNPNQAINGLMTRWIDEGMIDSADVAKDDKPESRDWKKVYDAMDADFTRDAQAFDADLKSYLATRAAEARQALGQAAH